MVATTATATISGLTTPSAGSSGTCPRTWSTDASTRLATRASKPPISLRGLPASSDCASAMSDITADEMQRLVETLGAIGEQPGGGIVRPVYGSAWVSTQRRLAQWMEEAGLSVRQDAVGNLFGRIEGDSPRTVLTGSHFDTVKLGGRYDGALGVLSALAALRRLKQQLGTPRKSLEMVALCEEEDSRFHGNFWGTRGILGLIESAELESLSDESGVTIAAAMR